MIDKVTRGDVKVLLPQRQPRRPRFTPAKTQRRSRLTQRSTAKKFYDIIPTQPKDLVKIVMPRKKSSLSCAGSPFA